MGIPHDDPHKSAFHRTGVSLFWDETRMSRILFQSTLDLNVTPRRPVPNSPADTHGIPLTCGLGSNAHALRKRGAMKLSNVSVRAL